MLLLLWPRFDSQSGNVIPGASGGANGLDNGSLTGRSKILISWSKIHRLNQSLHHQPNPSYFVINCSKALYCHRLHVNSSCIVFYSLLIA